MWNRKREETPAPKTTAPAPTNADLSREGIPMSTYGTRRIDDPGVQIAAIGKTVQIKGQIYAREDLLVDGEVEGAIEMPEHRLTVGPNGKVNAGIKAREVIVQGAVHGNLEAGERIEIRREAKVAGDIKTARIVIEDGAYFKGNIDMVKHEVIRPAQKPPAQAAAVKAAPAAATPAVPPAGK